MTARYIFLLATLLLIAAFFKGDFAFIVLYLFLGTYIFSRLWFNYSSKQIRCKRSFIQRAFWNEDIPITLVIHNDGWLPIPWMHLRESVPPDIATEKEIAQVVSLHPRSECTLEYKLRGRKRGYYFIGPLMTTFGDTLGLLENYHYETKPDHLTIYPQIINLTRVQLFSRSPQGTLRHTQPIYEDPTRIINKRDYVAGDSLRRIDWKASAVSGRLQVKQYEPSIALEVAIFLNLNSREYLSQFRYDSMELAIVIAASIANWVVRQKQSVGLITNGIDSTNGQGAKPVLPRKGRGNLTRILETLARVQVTENDTLVDLLNTFCPRLSWGVSLVIITNEINDSLFDELFQAQRHGQLITLVVSGRTNNFQEARKKAESIGIPFFEFQDETDLDIWRH